MSTLIDCPSCRRKLRVPDEYLGKTVRCPSCAETFRTPEAAPATSPAPAATTPAPGPVSASPLLDVPLQLEIEEKRPATGPAAPSAQNEPAPRRDRDIEDDARDQPRRDRVRRPRRDFEPCPRCGDDIRRGAACPYCGYDLEEQADGYPRRERVRRDAEPHRGGTVQALGICSLVCAAFYIFPLGIPLGIAAWLMGRRDLQKMADGVMDPGGRKKTKDGWLCGLIGTCLNAVWGMGCVGLVSLLIFFEEESAANRPQPPVAPKQAAGGGRVLPQQPQEKGITLTGPGGEFRIRRGETKPLRVQIRRTAGFGREIDVVMVQQQPPGGLIVTPQGARPKGASTRQDFVVTAAADATLGEHVLHFSANFSDDEPDDEAVLDVKVRIVAK